MTPYYNTDYNTYIYKNDKRKAKVNWQGRKKGNHAKVIYFWRGGKFRNNYRNKSG